MHTINSRLNNRFPASGCWALLILAIFLAWSWSYDKWSVASWQTPISDESDARFTAGWTHAYREGVISPLGSKIIPRLGAPYEGNWNDFPMSDDFLFATIGYMARIIGLGAAMNLAVLLVVLLNGCAFYGATRILKYDRLLSLPLAFAYALPAFAYNQNLQHITVLACWAFPLILALIVKAFQAGKTYPVERKHFFIACLVGLLCGMTFVYNSWMVAQLVVLAALVALLRKEKSAAKLLCLGAVAVFAGTLLVNLDTAFFWLQHGTPKDSFYRPIFDGEREAIRLPGLFFPAEHNIQAIVNWTQKHFYKAEFPLGEDASTYLGIIGIAGLLAMCGVTFWNLWRKRPLRPHLFFWQTLWVFAYSIAGGVNLLLFIAGFNFFRATNRYSILILALALLFLARLLTRAHLGRWRIPLAVAIFGVVLVDQVRPATTAREIQSRHGLIVAHVDYFSALEKALPKSAMIFLMPVTQFPEHPLPHAGKWRDYEGLIPYIHTKDLRFSYGTTKGRGQEMWQFALMQQPVDKIVQSLSQYGFAAILIDTRFFEKNAQSIINALRLQPSVEIVNIAHPYYVAMRLPPLLPGAARTTPPPFARLGTGFHGWEKDGSGNVFSWAKQSGRLTLTNFLPMPLDVEISFQVVTLRPQTITITTPSGDISVEARAGVYNPVSLKCTLRPGVNNIKFTSALPAEPLNKLLSSASADTRPVSAGIWNLSVTPR